MRRPGTGSPRTSRKTRSGWQRHWHKVYILTAGINTQLYVTSLVKRAAAWTRQTDAAKIAASLAVKLRFMHRIQSANVIACEAWKQAVIHKHFQLLYSRMFARVDLANARAHSRHGCSTNSINMLQQCESDVKVLFNGSDFRARWSCSLCYFLTNSV